MAPFRYFVPLVPSSKTRWLLLRFLWSPRQRLGLLRWLSKSRRNNVKSKSTFGRAFLLFIIYYLFGAVFFVCSGPLVKDSVASFFFFSFFFFLFYSEDGGGRPVPFYYLVRSLAFSFSFSFYFSFYMQGFLFIHKGP